MRLLLDIGNTNLKWALHEVGTTLVRGGAEAHAGGDFGAILTVLLADCPKPREVVVSNVAGEGVAGLVREAVDRRWGIPVRFVTSRREGHGVRSAYGRPQRLGNDRWVAMVAAHTLWPGTVMVADCGTAVTVDVVTADGHHRGGLIMPGLAMMRRALGGGTSDIGMVEEGRFTARADNTADAVFSGTLGMLRAALERIAAETREEFGPPVSAVITGGDAAALLARLSGEWHHEPQLVLRGLAIITED